MRISAEDVLENSLGGKGGRKGKGEAGRRRSGRRRGKPIEDSHLPCPQVPHATFRRQREGKRGIWPYPRLRAYEVSDLDDERARDERKGRRGKGELELNQVSLQLLVSL